MPKETMTPRERWQAVLERRQPDRVPMDFWGTDEAVANLMNHLGCPNRREALEKLHVDFVVKLKPDYVGPRLAPGVDAFGRSYRMVS